MRHKHEREIAPTDTANWMDQDAVIVVTAWDDVASQEHTRTRHCNSPRSGAVHGSSVDVSLGRHYRRRRFYG